MRSKYLGAQDFKICSSYVNSNFLQISSSRLDSKLILQQLRQILCCFSKRKIGWWVRAAGLCSGKANAVGVAARGGARSAARQLFHRETSIGDLLCRDLDELVGCRRVYTWVMLWLLNKLLEHNSIDYNQWTVNKCNNSWVQPLVYIYTSLHPPTTHYTERKGAFNDKLFVAE